MTTLIIAVFVAGYLAIAFENTIKVNKAAVALITAVLCWTIYIVNTPDKEHVTDQLAHKLGEISGILFFLLGAMTIVELIDAYNGFDLLTVRMTQTKKRKLLWMIALLTFFLSAILDNLTTTIVLISFLKKLIRDKDSRLILAGIVIIAANAGGAWSPIGDVTTTMLWLGGQVTASGIMPSLLLPCLVCLAAPVIYLSLKGRGRLERLANAEKSYMYLVTRGQQTIILTSGIIILLFVPVFKTYTHLPPYMGMLLGLGILWVITEIIKGNKNEQASHVLSVAQALRKIDASSILFFLGILVSVGALQAIGLLSTLAGWMSDHIGNDNIIVVTIGLLSAIIDNVPLVAAAQGMYDMSNYPPDCFFWHFLAYCTGTGGSILVIGSAAGVAAMGLEDIRFFWYLKKISPLAFAGFISGVFMIVLQRYLF